MESTPQPAATVEADKEEEVEEEEEVSAPVVFLCIKCHLIVGDSYAFHSTNPDMQTITLSAASNVKRSEELFTSHNGHDIGSTFINFKCSGCNNPLGRYYLTTSSDLDNLREVFTFEVKNVSSYELGKARHGKIPAAPTITDESEGKKRIILESGESLEETLAFMQTEIDKILHVMCGLDDRIGSLEKMKRQRQDEPQNSPSLRNEELILTGPAKNRRKLEPQIYPSI